MRIWDINPGYLNRQSLLGEHRELHGMVSIFVNGKKGYSQHPETLRWVGFGWALMMRHQQIAAEMKLRGYTDRSPVDLDQNPENWPTDFIDSPWQQFEIIKNKYKDKELGRISLPENAQSLWSQHKYSVLARDPNKYKEIGRRLAQKPKDTLEDSADELTMILRIRPTEGGIRNALQHMWGYISEVNPPEKEIVSSWSLTTLLNETQQRAMESREPYLMQSTALSELAVWIPPLSN